MDIFCFIKMIQRSKNKRHIEGLIFKLAQIQGIPLV